MPSTYVPSSRIDVDKDLDMNGMKAVNAHDSEHDTDFVTQKQLESFRPQTDYGLLGVMDSINTIFQTKSEVGFELDTTRLYINGVRQFKGSDYIEIDSYNVEIFIPPEVNDNLILDYLIKLI